MDKENKIDKHLDDHNSRRIFFIDVGDMPPTHAQQFLECVIKNVSGKGE